jgi:hypothetical protein
MLADAKAEAQKALPLKSLAVAQEALLVRKALGERVLHHSPSPAPHAHLALA